MLFFGYISANFLQAGTMISILHDVCDIPGHFSKLIYNTTYKSLASPIFILMMHVWFWFRLVALPLLLHDVFKYYYYPPGLEEL